MASLVGFWGFNYPKCKGRKRAKKGKQSKQSNLFVLQPHIDKAIFYLPLGGICLMKGVTNNADIKAT
jgi:hypothetical protein